jgi:hypothetical protein
LPRRETIAIAATNAATGDAAQVKMRMSRSVVAITSDAGAPIAATWISEQQ